MMETGSSYEFISWVFNCLDTVEKYKNNQDCDDGYLEVYKASEFGLNIQIFNNLLALRVLIESRFNISFYALKRKMWEYY